MTSIFKISRVALKGIESKSEQHFLSLINVISIGFPSRVPERWDAGLFASAGYSPGWASPAEQPWAGHPLATCTWAPRAPLSTCSHLVMSGMSWVQGWLEWLLSQVRLQEGTPQLGSSQCVVAPSLHLWFPLTCWKQECASSQIVCFVSWLVHSLAPFGDLWQMKQGAIASLSCFSTQTPFADIQEAPSSAEKHLYTVFQAQSCQRWILSLHGTVLHNFPSLCRIDNVHFQTLCLLLVEEAEESCNKNIGRQLPVLHPPHSLIPPLILISFLPGSIILSVAG